LIIVLRVTTNEQLNREIAHVRTDGDHEFLCLRREETPLTANQM
jgi:hypothetical protein